MLELDGITTVRRPDNTRWSDGAVYRFGVRLTDREIGGELYEEAAVEEIQTYERFQAFVAREFGVWFRYPPAEEPGSGAVAWSELLASVWGRAPEGAAEEPPPYFDAAPWSPEED